MRRLRTQTESRRAKHFIGCGYSESYAVREFNRAERGEAFKSRSVGAWKSVLSHLAPSRRGCAGRLKCEFCQSWLNYGDEEGPFAVYDYWNALERPASHGGDRG